MSKVRARSIPPVLAAAVALTISACSGAEGQDVVNLSVNYPISDNHAYSRAFLEYAEQVTERTGGEVTFDHHYNAALCELPEAIECVSNGTVDIAFETHAYTPELALASLSSTAFVSSDLQGATDAHSQLHRDNEEYRAEFDERNVELLFHVANSSPVLAMGAPLDSLDDVEGMSIRAAGSMAGAMEDLGANAVATAPVEIYESVERGVVQGLALPLESVVDLRLHEVGPYIYDIGEYVGVYAMSGFAINQSLWEGLSDEHRAVMTEVAAEMEPSFVDDYLVPFIAEVCGTAVDEGATVEPIGPADVGQDWAARGREEQLAAWMNNAGSVADPQAAVDQYLEAYENHAGAPTTPTHDICSDAA